jgi:hypothetical protein
VERPQEGYVICVEGHDERRYVVWHPWEGYVLSAHGSAACLFETREQAALEASHWTRFGSVFVDGVGRQAPAAARSDL